MACDQQLFCLTILSLVPRQFSLLCLMICFRAWDEARLYCHINQSSLGGAGHSPGYTSACGSHNEHVLSATWHFDDLISSKLVKIRWAHVCFPLIFNRKIQINFQIFMVCTFNSQYMLESFNMIHNGENMIALTVSKKWVSHYNYYSFLFPIQIDRVARGIPISSAATVVLPYSFTILTALLMNSDQRLIWDAFNS